MKHKFSVSLSLALILAMMVTSLAVADQVVNTIDNTIDSALETRTIEAGDSTVVGFYIKNINNNGGDPVNSCNVSEQEPATVKFDVPEGVTADPTSLVFTDCNIATQTKYVTFSSNMADSYEIRILSVTGGKTGGAWDTAPAAFELEVDAPANTSPSVSVTGVTDGASYEFGSVPDAVCEVTDAEDGNTSFAATLSAITGPLSAYGLGSQTASCAHTDSGGLSASASATYTIVDTTAPDVTVTPDRAPDQNGWYNAPVDFETIGSDDASGVASCTGLQTYSTPDGTGLTVIGSCTDNAGNVGNGTSAAFNFDDTNPTLTWDPGVYADGSIFYFGFVPAWPPNPCVAADDLSGPNGCTVIGYSAAVGTHTLTATAYDQAGNNYSETRSYTVNAWTLNGFYNPVDMNGVFNVVKGGSTVPLKFEIFAGSELTEISSIKTLLATPVACTGGSEDLIETVSTGGTSLRYDWTSGQFIFNWQTPKKPGNCYKVTMTTQDDSTLVALFKLK